METVALNPVWDFNEIPKPIPLPHDFFNAVAALANRIKVDRSPGRRTYEFLRFFQDWDGEILETVYAVKYYAKKGKKPENCKWQLAFAGTPTRRWCSGNLLYSRMAGYVMIWEESECRCSIVTRYGFDATMYASSDKWRPNLKAADLSDEPNVDDPYNRLASLKNYPRYLDPVQMNLDLIESDSYKAIEYVRSFSEHRDLELLQKARISYLWREKRLLNAKPKYRKRLLSYIKANLKDIQDRHPSMTFIVKAMGEGVGIPKYEWNETVRGVANVLCGPNGRFSIVEAEEVAKYLQRQNGGPIHYRDYLNLSERMGRDMTARGVLFPRDFCRQFDEMRAIARAEESEGMEKSIAERIAELNLPMKYYSKGFSVRILDTQQSMTEVGNALHNCVGTSGYGMAMARGQIVVLAVYFDGKPMNCVELSTPVKGGAMYRVKQNRGDHNLDSERQKDVEAFVANYVKKANRAWREGHARA